MRAGSLRDLITVENFTTTKDEVGGDLKEYAEFTRAYAEVTDLGTKQKYFQARYEDVEVKTFRIRYVIGITTAMRIKLDNEYFDIKEIVDPYNRKRELLIVAQKAG